MSRLIVRTSALILLVLACTSYATWATTCSDDANTLSAHCIRADASKPYCVVKNPLSPETSQYKECSECVPLKTGNRYLCDCPPNQYCSAKDGEAGTCVSFQAQGRRCINFANTGQLLNRNYAEDYKCADLYSDSNGDLVANHEGSCMGGICRFCTITERSTSLCGANQAMLQKPQVCVYPGDKIYEDDQYWALGYFHGHPAAGWLATIFPFFLIMLGISIFHYIRGRNNN